MSVQMELSRIIISEVNDQQVVYLKEVEGDRSFPILIGLFEATSIDRRVKHHPSPRPLTHDLLVAAVELLGGEFQDVVISELKEHTYFATLRVQKDGEIIEIDSRPSDASPSRSPVSRTCRSTLPKRCLRACWADRYLIASRNPRARAARALVTASAWRRISATGSPSSTMCSRSSMTSSSCRESMSN